jgi:hypothetical protein
MRRQLLVSIFHWGSAVLTALVLALFIVLTIVDRKPAHAGRWEEGMCLLVVWANLIDCWKLSFPQRLA